MANYIIPKANLEELTKKLNHIRNKGVNVTFNILNDNIEYPVPELGEGKVIPCVEVEVEGTYVINGWRFVGTIQHSKPENIIRLADYELGEHIPQKYRTAEKECEHCHIKRDRNDTYLIFNEDTLEWKQVGRTCLKNYTSGLDSQTCADFLDVIHYINNINNAVREDDFESFPGIKNSARYRMDYVRKKAYPYVQQNGYTSGVTGEAFVQELIKDRIKREASDTQINEITAWLDTANNDYLRNARAIWNKDYFENRDAALLTSAIYSFFKNLQRDNARAAERQNNLNNPDNTYAGEVGDKVTFTVAAEPITIYTRNSGVRFNYDDSYPVYKIIGTDGRSYIWGNSSFKEIRVGDILTGTIKKLSERPNGEKQTEVTRCKVVGHQPPRTGFFDPVGE